MVGDEGRQGLVQIVQWIKFVSVMYMFSMERKVHCGDKHLNINSTVTDVTLEISLSFQPTVIKAEKHFNIQSLLKIFEMIGKSMCIIQFLLALFSLREIQKKRYYENLKTYVPCPV